MFCFGGSDEPVLPPEIAHTIQRHLRIVGEVVSAGDRACETYLEPERGSFEQQARDVDKHEHQADTVRTHVERYAYNHDFAGDREFVEFSIALDRIADAMEDVVDFLDEREPVFPDTKDTMLKLSARSALAYRPFRDMPTLFADEIQIDQLNQTIHRINAIEDSTDDVQKRTMRSIWQSDEPLARKNLLTDWVEHVVRVSDECEEASYKLRHYLLAIR